MSSNGHRGSKAAKTTSAVVLWGAALLVGCVVGVEFQARLAKADMAKADGLPLRQLAQSDAKNNLEVVPGNSTTTTTTTYGGWTVACNESGTPATKVCTANFRVINKQNNSNLLVWLFGRNAKGEALSEFLTLTDVLIEPGVVLTLDEGKPVRVGYVSCSTNGCKASLALDTTLIKQMKSASTAKLDMTRLDGQVIQFKMDVPGIGAALTDLGF